MRKPVIVSFYTPNYHEEYSRFTAALRKFDFEFYVESIPSRGQWIDNIYFRAEFVRMMLDKFNRDIVWLDIDAEVLRYPHLFVDFPGDFGAASFLWPSGKKEVLGGTMYFRHCPRTIDLVNRWCALNQSLPKQPRSQLVLQESLRQWAKESEIPANIITLPDEYTYIKRFMPDVTDPVIEHHQASGKHRRSDLEGFDCERVSGEYPDSIVYAD